MDWQKGEESKNLEDRRRMKPRTMAMGGMTTLVVMVVAYYLGINPQALNQLIGNAQVNQQGNGQVAQGPLSPEEEKQREFNAKVLGFTEKVWDEQFRELGKKYEPPHMVLFTDMVETGCGNAPAAVGPFYCPADMTVYLDPTFYDELEATLGGSKAEFSQAYVIAHEVGHHVQNLLGYSRIVDQKRQELSKTEFNRWSVRLELQADYLAGVWAHHGQKQFNFINTADIEEAIKSANAIGDDRIQKRSRGFTSPENYTHGTSEQRVRSFTLGLKTGDMSRLKDFFEAPYEDL